MAKENAGSLVNLLFDEYELLYAFYCLGLAVGL